MMHLKRSPERGLTLIEMMITMLIVGMGAISTVSMLTTAQIYNSMEQERSRAHQIVSERLEEIQRDLYTFITTGSEVTIWDNGTPDDTDDDTKGTLEVRVTDPDGTVITVAPNPAVRLMVEVTLTWNPRGRIGGKTMRESVMTYIAP